MMRVSVSFLKLGTRVTEHEYGYALIDYAYFTKVMGQIFIIY